MTRKDAILLGVKMYDEGRVCLRGHVPVVRYASNSVCRQCAHEDGALHQEMAPEDSAEGSRRWREHNREHDAESSRRWRKTNPAAAAAQLKQYNAWKRRANLILPEHVARVRALYARAALFGDEVDHVIPLRGRNVCGLHILCNLQVLTVTENRRKHNHFKGENS